MTNYCRNCGSKLNEGIAFCPNCGTAVDQINNNQTQQINNNINMNQQMPQNINQTYTSSNDNTVIAFILSLSGFLCCTYLAIPGLIMSILSLQKINIGSISNKHKGLAIAGIVLGAISIIIMINNIVNPDPEITKMINDLING